MCISNRFPGDTHAVTQRPHLENQRYPVLELATHLVSILLLEVQTGVSNLLTRFPITGIDITGQMTLGLTVTLRLLVSKIATKTTVPSIVIEFYSLQSIFTVITSFKPSYPVAY